MELSRRLYARASMPETPCSGSLACTKAVAHRSYSPGTRAGGLFPALARELKLRAKCESALRSTTPPSTSSITASITQTVTVAANATGTGRRRSPSAIGYANGTATATGALPPAGSQSTYDQWLPGLGSRVLTDIVAAPGPSR
jgi:hypothetical protein